MILDKLAAATRKRVEQAKEKIPLKAMENLAFEALEKTKGQAFSFEQSLSSPGISLICEVKRASPSGGLIAGEFPYVEIAKDYEAAGADAISVLTEPEYFLGSSSYLTDISHEVKIPLLRKDFTVDPYQIYEAKVIGASGVLLICALLRHNFRGRKRNQKSGRYQAFDRVRGQCCPDRGKPDEFP